MNAAAARVAPVTGAPITLVKRLGIALGVALVTGLIAFVRYRVHPDWTTDFDQMWYAARALLGGENPYAAVGPGRTFDWPWALYYPLPAVLVSTPFAFLPLGLARIAFSAVGGFVVGFAIAPQWRLRWPILLSMAFFSAILRNQWSPFVLAAAWVPIAGAVVALKPNVGLITLAVQDRRALIISIGGALVLVAASFAVRPDWLATWLTIVRDAPNKEVAVLQPFGFLLLFALFAWRSVEGRTLVAMSIVPHTPSLYDLLPIFIATRTARQALVVAVLTHALYWSVLAVGPYPDRDSAFAVIARSEVVVVLLPVLAIVLARAWREHRQMQSSQSGVFPAAPSRLDFLADRGMAVAAAISLGIQLWIVVLP